MEVVCNLYVPSALPKLYSITTCSKNSQRPGLCWDGVSAVQVGIFLIKMNISYYITHNVFVFFFKGTSVQHPDDKACTEASLTAALQLLQLARPSLLTGRTAQYPQVSFTELNWNNSGTRIISQKPLQRIQVLYRWYNCCFFFFFLFFCWFWHLRTPNPVYPVQAQLRSPSLMSRTHFGWGSRWKGGRKKQRWNNS